jgi:Predicted membrane protein (DUF2306)
MPLNDPNRILGAILKWAVVVLLCKVTIHILYNYQGYFPPNFESDFLRGRESYFFGSYQVAFYAHILASPITLVTGTILMSRRFRERYPARHRMIGKWHVLIVLALVVPSGLWMATRAYTGAIAGIGFALLSIATGFCAAVGWRQAVLRKFTAHQRWMTRCYLLLCSAIVLRLMAGFFTIIQAEPEWTYQLAAWLSWILPLAGFEAFEKIHARWT